jgi:hypothetical protein
MNSPVKSKDYYLAQATSNSSTPVKTGVEKQKVVVLGVGLLVVSVAALFKRRIYAPDAKHHPDFYVTDLEAYNESGEKILLSGSGSCFKAGEFAEAFE